ncbi:ABC transporter permease [Sorangium sp. So ce726]|uniref:ABC transporter permease n=1 Tax=Sorangium sp. So ce726 TaxID=3133319 RepID=UPI003F619121
MHSKIALPCALLALAATGTGCNLIFGIEPGTEGASAASSMTSAGSGDGGSTQTTSGAGSDGGDGGDGDGGHGGDGGDGAGGHGGGAPSCPRPSCAAGECPVTQMQGELGSNVKGMAVTRDLVLLANDGAIVAVPKDGGAARTLPGTLGFGDTAWVTYSGGQLSWTNWGNGDVLGISIDPPSSSPIRIATVPPPEGEHVVTGFGRIASFGDSVYWATQTPTAVWRAKADGSQALAEQVASGERVIGVAVDATHVYWSEYLARQILRKRKDALGETAEVFAETNGYPSALVLANGVVHWVTDGTGAIQSKATDAAPSAPPFTTTVDAQAISKSLAVDDEFVYWTVYENSQGQGEVRRAHLGKGDTITLATGQPYFFEIAVDCGSIYWNVNNIEAEEEGVVFQMPKPSN